MLYEFVGVGSMISIYMRHVDGHETLDFVDEASMVQTYLENECDALIDTLSRDELESSVFPIVWNIYDHEQRQIVDSGIIVLDTDHIEGYTILWDD